MNKNILNVAKSIDISIGKREIDTENFKDVMKQLRKNFPELNFRYEKGTEKVVVIIDEQDVLKISVGTPEDVDFLEIERKSEAARLFPEIYSPISVVYNSPDTGRKFYTQPIVIEQFVNDTDNKYHASELALDVLDSYSNSVYSFDDDWCGIMIDKFGFDYYKSFIDYVAENRWAFRDMHDGNYGYSKNGIPQIIDYTDER